MSRASTFKRADSGHAAAVNPTSLRVGPPRAPKKSAKTSKSAKTTASATAKEKSPKAAEEARSRANPRKQKADTPPKTNTRAAKPARPAADAPPPQKQRGWAHVAAQLLALLVMMVCAAIVLKLTLTPSPASVGIAHTNLTPGASIRLYLDNASVKQAVLQVGGNIVIGIPFGLLLPSISPRFRGLLRVMLATAFAITLVELTQRFFIEGRSFDVDDIILAVVGAAIGYVPFGRYFSLRVHPYHRHWWQRLLDRLLHRDRTDRDAAPARTRARQYFGLGAGASTAPKEQGTKTG